MRFLLGILVFLGICAPVFASQRDAIPPGFDRHETSPEWGTAASRKLGRGVSNVAFGWLEVFKGMEDVGREHGGLAGATWGPISGLGKAVGRTAAGLIEVATFPVPAPPNYEPIVKPEFVLNDD